MSFKKFDLDKDVFQNSYTINEHYDIIVSSSHNVYQLTPHFPNHWFSGGKSGSYYVEYYDKSRNDPSANRLFSISYGYTSSSILFSGTGFSPTNQNEKSLVYRLFAKKLLGSENKRFKIDDTELNEAVFVSVNRNQFKDFIIKKSARVGFNISGSPGVYNDIFISSISDRNSKIQNEFAGEYGQLYQIQLQGNYSSISGRNFGLVFYNAGVYVLNPNCILTSSENGNFWSGSYGYEVLAKGVSGTTFNDLLNALSYRILYVAHSGSSKVQSTFYRCKANPDEFNYSSNPSFVDQEGLIRTSVSATLSSVYITQVALLGENNEVLAVGKIKKPVKKDPATGLIITVRIDH